MIDWLAEKLGWLSMWHWRPATAFILSVASSLLTFAGSQEDWAWVVLFFAFVFAVWALLENVAGGVSAVAVGLLTAYLSFGLEKGLELSDRVSPIECKDLLGDEIIECLERDLRGGEEPSD